MGGTTSRQSVPRDMLASPDSDYENHSSSHSEPQLLEVRDASDLRRKIGGDSKATDRRKRNGESAKRSRDKRKMRITEMEENYEQLEEGHKRLLEENLKLRELVASLGGDVSTLPSVPPLDSISEDLAIPLKKAKHTKIECRVDTTANSFESEVTHNTSPQLELYNPLAVATTVLLLVCFPIMNMLSQMSTESLQAYMKTLSTQSATSTGCQSVPQQMNQKHSRCPQHLPHPSPTIAKTLLHLMKWNSNPDCSTSWSSFLTDLSNVTSPNQNSLVSNPQFLHHASAA